MAYHVRQVGGPAAAGPRFFILCGHGEGGGSAAVEGLPKGVRSLGNPTGGRASGQGYGRMRQHTPPLSAQ